VRFDLNDYSIPPEAVGRQLTLVASDVTVRILDGSFEIARHVRTYDRHQLVLDPAHQEAVLRIKRKAFHSTPGGRLEQAVPESKTFLDLAFAHGESAGAQTAQLMKLLDQYGTVALRRAIAERSNATLRVRLRWLSCCAADLALHCLASISAAIRKPWRSISARMIWRPTMNSPAPKMTTMTNNNLAAQLKQIGLCALPTQLDDFIARVTQARCSAHQILEELAKAEVSERSRRSLERRLRISGIKRFKPMADFDWSWPAKIERDVIERALTLDFLGATRNLILVGRNGLGKTMIAQNIAHAAVLAGHTVLFRSAAALLEELHRQSPEGRRGKLRGYANVGLLCIDEVGYLSFDDKAADLLYEVVNRRYERKPVILTTNRPFKEWNEVFPNATCIVTLLDRLLHHADVTAIEGDSYRMRESEQETAARRRKK
jgi:DNA replication protein DnaC